MTVELSHPYSLTHHAVCQMHRRRISAEAVLATVRYGRRAWIRGARIFAIGQREVARWRVHGIDVQQFEGIHVVTSPEGAILTVYRNRDLRDMRRPSGSHRRRRS
ncbi:MAG: hypothetical protein KatS3mg060_1988 [Dehalococcoidia bacterium]|nr:MAG: hypothetical protein KatS3mg060_1988 [Dehalococcoidia bacterium]